MKAVVSNKIYIENATPQFFAWCKKTLEFPNPDYAKKQNMGLWTGNIEPVMVLWEHRGTTAILPYGCLANILQMGIPVEYAHGKRSERCSYNSSIKPFDYQEKAIKESYGRSGVLVMPCGSGKTQTALQLASLYGLKTLWITHTTDLLKQSLDRAKSCFNMPDNMYGTITGGKINVGEAITFATVQTLSKIDLEPYQSYWDVVIVDECHMAVGTPTKLMMFYKVVSYLNAPIKIGLTATPERNDGLERCMFALLGNIICRIPEEAVKKNTVPIQITVDHNSLYSPSDRVLNPDGTLNYTELINDLCKCESRNKYIASIVNKINSCGLTCLVMSDRVSHLTELRQLVGEDYTQQIYGAGESAKAKKERESCLGDLRSKKLRCVFATYQLAKVGLDVNTLGCVVFATPKKDKITIVQSCGRVGRKAPGKDIGYVYDIVDEGLSIFVNYSRIRKRIYKSKKYQILEI